MPNQYKSLSPCVYHRVPTNADTPPNKSPPRVLPWRVAGGKTSTAGAPGRGSRRFVFESSVDLKIKIRRSTRRPSSTTHYGLEDLKNNSPWHTSRTTRRGTHRLSLTTRCGSRRPHRQPAIFTFSIGINSCEHETSSSTSTPTSSTHRDPSRSAAVSCSYYTPTSIKHA